MKRRLRTNVGGGASVTFRVLFFSSSQSKNDTDVDSAKLLGRFEIDVGGASSVVAIVLITKNEVVNPFDL